MLNKFSILALLLSTVIAKDDSVPPKTRGLLYPRESETREVRLLDGIWNFVKSDGNDQMLGVTEGWYKDDLIKSRPIIPMPVPASYNDLTTDAALRDHDGTVWYERVLFIPREWASKQRVWLRFGSVHYSAIVWLNGENLTKHEIGHLPFEMEITDYASYGAENRLTVLCNNSLTITTVPQGKGQSYGFDFFNYAGIHRSVHLYTTPKVFIEDIAVTTDFDANKIGYINYDITSNGGNTDNQLYVQVQLRNKNGTIVANNKSKDDLKGQLKVPNAKLWWPYLMHPEPGYLYTLEIYLHDGAADETLLDVYRLKVGIRTLQWTNTSVLLNGKEIYLRGLGRHEDSDIHGRGFDLALLIRDFNLIKWLGANTYRTSHYPYSEESMQLADEQGIMVIDECSSVNTKNFSDALLLNHKSSLEQLIHRDRNHPSVIMWSIANEPNSWTEPTDVYFEKVAKYTKSLDPTRPITASVFHSNYTRAPTFNLSDFVDVISFNRYQGWYQHTGRLHKIHKFLTKEAIKFNELHKKPVILSEYGADTLEGLHLLPDYVWSEEFQSNLFSKYFEAFDFLRQKKWFIGEFVWNFADFMTKQEIKRIGGNKKGIFTRNRQPKAAAFVLRQRYLSLANSLDNYKLPEDLFPYILKTKV